MTATERDDMCRAGMLWAEIVDLPAGPGVAALAAALASERERALAPVLAVCDELDADSERAYQRSCGHRDEGSDGQYRAYEDAADRIRRAAQDPPC